MFACCWPRALLNCAQPVTLRQRATPARPARPSATGRVTAGLITTGGSTRTEIAYGVAVPSTVVGDANDCPRRTARRRLPAPAAFAGPASITRLMPPRHILIVNAR